MTQIKKSKAFFGAIFLSLIGTLLSSVSAEADAVWVPPKDTFHGAFSFTYAQWDQYLQNGSNTVNLPGDINQFEFTTYLEYVPIENLSFDLIAPIVISQRKFVFVVTDPAGDIIDVTLGAGGQVRDTDTNAGIGDVTLGSKYIFFDKLVSLGVRPYIKFPGTYDYGEVENAPGDGQTDLGMAFLSGAYFSSIRSYIRGSLAYVVRLGEPNNQIEIMLEPGFNVTRSFQVRFIYQHIEQIGGDDILFYDPMTFYPSVEEDADRIGGGLSYRANESFGIFALYQQTIAGNNTANTKAFTIGFDVAF